MAEKLLRFHHSVSCQRYLLIEPKTKAFLKEKYGTAIAQAYPGQEDQALNQLTEYYYQGAINSVLSARERSRNGIINLLSDFLNLFPGGGFAGATLKEGSVIARGARAVGQAGQKVKNIARGARAVGNAGQKVKNIFGKSGEEILAKLGKTGRLPKVENPSIATNTATIGRKNLRL